MPQTPIPSIPTVRDRVWLWGCVASLVCYLLRSEAIPAFLKEASRLLGKL